MKKTILILAFALLAAVSLTFVACDSAKTPEDTTPDTTVTTDTPTEPVTEAPTSPETDPETEAPTEEITTEEETTEEVTEPETLEVDLEKVTVSSSLALFESLFTTADKDTCVDDLVDVFGNPAVEDGVKIPLVYQGAIHLGDIDLSKYKKVTVTYATSSASGTVADYETTQKRAMLTQADTKGELSPAEDAIIAFAVYYIPSTTWQLTTVEIDLTNVDYSGALFLTFDFTEGVNLYHAVTGVVFEG
ncbi:MAG: hypothetical protein J6B24_06475 [Clostridia bacterium]|nr:hypothetical protein [Clostridia bacterium]